MGEFVGFTYKLPESRRAILAQRTSQLVLVVILALSSIAPGSDHKKLREEEVSRQKEGGYALAEFRFGSVKVADFTKKNHWRDEERLPPPNDKVQHGLLSPDGALIALELNQYGTDSLGIFHGDGSELQNTRAFFAAFAGLPTGSRWLRRKNGHLILDLCC